MDAGPFKGISLNTTYIRKWKLAQWLSISFAILFVVLDLIYLFYVYAIIGKIWFYVGYLAIITAFVVIRHLLIRKQKRMHIHHWMLFTFLTTLFGSQSPFFTIQLGFLTGCMCEGATRFGCTPMYHMRKKHNLMSSTVHPLIKEEAKDSGNYLGKLQHNDLDGNAHSFLKFLEFESF